MIPTALLPSTTTDAESDCPQELVADSAKRIRFSSRNDASSRNHTFVDEHD